MNYNTATNLMLEAMGGTSSIVGEFAELLVAEYYDGEKLVASSKSADIKLQDGRTIQVKARMLRQTLTTSLGIIRSWDFDLLVVVLFLPDGRVIEALEMDMETAKSMSTQNDHQGGRVISTTQKFLRHKNAKNITKGLNEIINNGKRMGNDKAQISLEGARNPQQIKYNGSSIDTCKNNHESFQTFVQRTLQFVFAHGLLMQEEINLLQTKEYSKRFFGLEMPFLETNTSKLRDKNGTSRYWVTMVFGGKYYACSQWWREKLHIYEPKFSAWIEHIIASNNANKKL